MDEKRFGQRLNELRELTGVSAREMSLAIGQNDSYINRIENGKNFPSMQGFFYICEYLHISPEEFFSFDVTDPAGLKEISPLLAHLSSEELDALSVLLKHRD